MQWQTVEETYNIRYKSARRRQIATYRKLDTDLNTIV